MPDKILIVDYNNSVYRAITTFGPPASHMICSGDGFVCNHKLGAEGIVHCNCGAKYNAGDAFCYGDRYLIIYNWFRNIRPLIEQFTPDKCFICLEGHPQFRYDLYADYKKSRIIKRGEANKEKTEKFNIASNEILRLLQYFPITIAKAENYEADDLNYSLCENLKDEDIIVLTSDQDHLQLLQKGYRNCKVYNPIKKSYMEMPTVFYVAWKCLNGDKSDDIPSLLSPKKALATINDPELFKKFMSIEENRASFNMNRQLIEFRQIPEEEIILKEGIRNFKLVKEEFSKMEFNSIINDVSWEKYTKTFNCLRY